VKQFACKDITEAMRLRYEKAIGVKIQELQRLQEAFSFAVQALRELRSPAADEAARMAKDSTR
jgi:plasmid maintenance system antidote protein VapI